MAEKILGPAGSKRRKRFLWVPTLLIACIALFVIGNAQAVHDLQFQLDGNTATSCGTGPNCKTSGTGAGQIYDWDSLFNADGSTTSIVNASNTSGFTQAAFNRDFKTKQSAHGAASTCSITDTGLNFCNSDDTTYATGSKDTLPISAASGSDWQCNQDNNVNSKIDIMNAYAASYTAPNGDKILYFGLDKNKDNGNNNVGFWFLQGDASCTSSGGAVDFQGAHQDGDILVTSAFTSGGGVSNIEVFRWTGDNATGCIDNPADPKLCDQEPFGSGADCKTTQTSTTTAPADAICATTNSGTLPINTNITTKWETSDATLGVGNTVVPPDFFEGGIDLTLAFKLVGQTAPSCFSTFIADTRSSQEPTATLFDFSRGRLGSCSATIHTTPSLTTTTLGSSDPVTDLANIAGTVNGGGTAPKPTGTVSFFLCGPSASNCLTGGTPVTGNPVTLGDCNPDVAGHSCATSGNVRSLLTAIGTYCFRAVYDPGSDTNYQSSAGILDGSATECFTVTSVASTSTTQKWLPQDSAHVTASGGATVAGYVVFQLYETTNCTGTVVQTFGGDPAARINVDSSGNATTNNTTYYVDTNIQISWKATFTSTNGVGSGDPAPCERSDIANLDDDITSP